MSASGTGASFPVRVGIDFGGTKIEAAALDREGRFLARRRAPNPRRYEEAIRAVRELVESVEREAGANGTVGVGAPGSLSPRTGLVRNANSTWLNGRAFKEDLSAALGREIRIANDANCLALSECVDGAARGARVVFAAILGTGCGGGVVVEGSLIAGANGIGGEWGHNPLPWPTHAELDAPGCWCGQQGCLETWISGSGLQSDFARVTGRSLTAEEIVASSRAGDAQARDALGRYIDRLGRGLAALCNTLDPDAIVLGGGLSNVTELYEALPAVIRSRVFSDVWQTPVAPAHWGDSSGVRGAARLWECTSHEAAR